VRAEAGVAKLQILVVARRQDIEHSPELAVYKPVTTMIHFLSGGAEGSLAIARRYSATSRDA
jgi:hypothetical protein